MRPIASAQSAHRFPLNSLFGAESHVRILRVLVESREPLSTAHIARRAEITAPGARRALVRLVQTGLVDRVSGDKRRLYALRKAGPLIAEIHQLFASEQRRFGGPTDLEVPRSVSTPRVFSHQYPEHLTHARSTGLVNLIKRDPSLIKRARIHVMLTLNQQASGNKDLEEWRDLLEHDSPAHLSQLLMSHSEQADRLRASSPFEAILSSNEREYLLAATDADG